MSPDQGPEALFEGSKRNSGYQTVSKFYNFIVESSGSTRRIQRAQDRENPTSLSQEIVHRTVYDQRVQYRPSVHNYPLLPRIYNPCHSRKTINRAPFHLEKRTLEQKLEEIKGEIEDRSCPLAPPRPPPDHRLKVLHSAEPPPEGPTLRRTTSQRPYTPPDHHLKALLSAGPPPEVPTFRRTTTQGQTICLRLDVLPKA
ncbi:hypothetical protein M5K25_006064 [Dendrobium thyrsiflorum]|uniref:Uncharacterized protein n=1 Tax=Dendrobium thyrsiflorum TaxID=117978 RepID=A0ABD0VHU9_DENTH